MDCKELRIGNLIYWNNIPCPVVHISVNDVCVADLTQTKLSSNLHYLDEGLNLIPLTEEWLVKFGFEKDAEEDYCKGDFCFRWQFDKLTLLCDIGHIQPPLLYVHQLQNLYFALTGEELKYEI